MVIATTAERGNAMSKILKDLVGKSCHIKTEDQEYLTGSAAIACKVLDEDDEWIKVTFTDYAGRRRTKMVRLEVLDSVEFFEG